MSEAMSKTVTQKTQGTAQLYFENKPWCWCYSSKVKLPEKPAVLGQTPFTFKHLFNDIESLC